MYKIIFYTDKNGKSELFDYMKELKNKSNVKENRIKSNKISAYINQLAKHGLSIGEPYIKHLVDDIWELRPLRDRILFAYWDNESFLLLNYFIKKTRKTPHREIIKAKKMSIEYKRRRNESNEK